MTPWNSAGVVAENSITGSTTTGLEPSTRPHRKSDCAVSRNARSSKVSSLIAPRSVLRTSRASELSRSDNVTGSRFGPITTQAFSPAPPPSARCIAYDRSLLLAASPSFPVSMRGTLRLARSTPNCGGNSPEISRAGAQRGSRISMKEETCTDSILLRGSAGKQGGKRRDLFRHASVRAAAANASVPRDAQTHEPASGRNDGEVVPYGDRVNSRDRALAWEWRPFETACDD